ncbi:MAG: hypothetical protein ACLS3M_04965 [Collinsella sp.]
MANEYKQTMNLPKTGFPMRAGLSKSEAQATRTGRTTRSTSKF